MNEQRAKEEECPYKKSCCITTTQAPIVAVAVVDAMQQLRFERLPDLIWRHVIMSSLPHLENLYAIAGYPLAMRFRKCYRPRFGSS